MAVFDKDRSAGYMVNRLARIFAAGLAERIKPLGLVPGQFPVLLALWEQDGRTQRDLVAALDVEQATLANTLARMERDGLVSRRPHPVDGRAQIVRLTPRARALEKPATDAASAVNRHLLSSLDPWERDAFLSVMGKVIAGAGDASA